MHFIRGRKKKNARFLLGLSNYEFYTPKTLTVYAYP